MPNINIEKEKMSKTEKEKIMKTNPELEQAIDFTRVQLAKNHDAMNKFPLAGREMAHNATGHGAKNILFFNFTRDNKKWACVVHDGEKFESNKDIIRSLHFNKTGGNGVQGSGGKTAMFLLDDIKNCEYMIHSKIGNGTKASTFSISRDGAKDGLLIEDKSNEWNGFLQGLLNKGSTKADYIDLYNKNNVIYLYRCDDAYYGGNNNITKTKNINTMMAISSSILEMTKGINGQPPSLNIKYIRESTYNDKTGLRTKHSIPLKNISLWDDFMIKEFETKVKNVKIPNPFDSSKPLKLSATIKLKIFPNFIYDNNAKPGLMSKNRVISNKKPIYNNEAIGCISDYNSIGLSVYQNGKLSEKNSSRVNLDPIFVGSQLMARHYIEALGVSRPSISKKWKVNKDKIAEYLGDASKVINQLNTDDVKHWTPNTNIEIRIDGVETPHQLGSVDNFFYTLDPSLIKEVVMKLLNEAKIQRSQPLVDYDKYIKEYINDDEEVSLLGYNKKIAKNTPRVTAILTTEAMSDMKNGKFEGIKVRGNKLIEIPVDMSKPLSVRLYNDNVQVKDKNVKSRFEGLTINHSEYTNKEGIYNIQTSDYFHYDVNDNKITHDVKSNIRSKDYFPKQSNEVYIDNVAYKLGFDIGIVIPEIKEHTKKKPFPRKKTKSKTEKDIYFKSADNKVLLVKWCYKTSKVLLNEKNSEIRQFAENLQSNTVLFSDVYDQINEFGHNIYVEKRLEDYAIRIEGNPKFTDDFADGYQWFLNEKVVQFLESSPDVKKLKKGHHAHLSATAEDKVEDSNKSNKKSETSLA